MRIVKPALMIIILLGVGILAIQPCTANQTNLDCTMQQAQDWLSRWNLEITWGLVVLLGGVAAWGMWLLGRSYLKRRGQATWRASQRHLGWLYVTIDAGSVALFLIWSRLDTRTALPLLNTARVVEYLVPLLIGIQTALMFSFDDEPLLEVQLTCQRPFVWSLLERQTVVIASHGLIGIVGGLAAWLMTGTNSADLVPILIGWIAPGVFLAGIGIFLTLSVRQSALSAGLVGLVWFAMMFGFEGLLQRWPFMWPLHLFLRPSAEYYALNRLFITLLGLFLIFLASRRLRDEEEVLLGTRAPVFSFRH